MWRHHRASPLSVCVCVCVCVYMCVCVCVYLTFLSFLVFASTSCCSEENVSLSSSVSSSWANICCCISLSLRVCRHTQIHTLSYVLYTSTYGCWKGSVLFLVWAVIANIKTVCYLFSNLVSFLFKHLLLLISVINNVLPTNQQLALHRLATTRNQHQQRITLIRTSITSAANSNDIYSTVQKV